MHIFRKVMYGLDAVMNMYRNDLYKARMSSSPLSRILLVSWANIKSTFVGGAYLTIVFNLAFGPGWLFYYLAKHNPENRNLFYNIGGTYFLVLLAIIVIAMITIILRPIFSWSKSTRARNRYARSLKAQGSRRIR